MGDRTPLAKLLMFGMKHIYMQWTPTGSRVGNEACVADGLLLTASTDAHLIESSTAASKPLRHCAFHLVTRV